MDRQFRELSVLYQFATMVSGPYQPVVKVAPREVLAVDPADGINWVEFGNRVRREDGGTVEIELQWSR